MAVGVPTSTTSTGTMIMVLVMGFIAGLLRLLLVVTSMVEMLTGMDMIADLEATQQTTAFAPEFCFRSVPLLCGIALSSGLRS